MDARGLTLVTLWNEYLAMAWQTLGVRLFFACVAAAIVALAARLSLGALNHALGRTRAHANARLLIDRIVQFTFLLVAALLVLDIFGVQPTALLAVVGVVGLAASLALQDVLRNLVAGLYILVERPFTIGEQIDFRAFSGTVETIELRTTALRTVAGQKVIIPNAMLFSDALVNRSAYGRQLVRLRVAVPLDAKAPTASQTEASNAPAVAQTDAARDEGHSLRDGARLLSEVQRAIEEAGAAGEEPGPTVLVESIGAEKVTLRAELWAKNGRAAASEAAWAVRRHLTDAEITVLE